MCEVSYKTYPTSWNYVVLYSISKLIFHSWFLRITKGPAHLLNSFKLFLSSTCVLKSILEIR